MQQKHIKSFYYFPHIHDIIVKTYPFYRSVINWVQGMDLASR